MFSGTNISCSETLLSYPLDSDVYIFAWLPQSTHNVLEFPQTVPNCCITSTSHKGSSSSQGKPSRLWQEFLRRHKLHACHTHIFKIISPQFNDPFDRDSLCNILLLHLVNQSYPLIYFSQDQNETDHEQIRKEVMNVLTQTEFDTSSKPEFSPRHSLSTPHGIFRNHEKILTQPVNFSTHYKSLKFDDDDECLFSRKDTLHVTYAHTDCLSSHTANQSR